MPLPATQEITETEDLVKEPWATPVLRRAAADEGMGAKISVLTEYTTRNFVGGPGS